MDKSVKIEANMQQVRNIGLGYAVVGSYSMKGKICGCEGKGMKSVLNQRKIRYICIALYQFGWAKDSKRNLITRLISICRNTHSISALTLMGVCRIRSRSPKLLFKRSGSISRKKINEKFLYSEALLGMLPTFSGMFGLISGWCGRYQNNSCYVYWKVTVLT